MNEPLIVPVDIAVDVARKFLAESDAVDIHSHLKVIESLASIRESLRNLLAALDAEEAQR